MIMFYTIIMTIVLFIIGLVTLYFMAKIDKRNKILENTPKTYFNVTDLKDQLSDEEIAVNLIYEDLMSMGYVATRDHANLSAKTDSINIPTFEDFYLACTYCKIYGKDKLKEYYDNFHLHYKILILATKKYCLIPNDGAYDGTGDVKGDYRRKNFVDTLYEIEKLKKIDKELSDL